MPFGRGFWGWGGYGYNPWFWRCRWFPWLPRWWWTGMYEQSGVPYAPTPYAPTPTPTPQQESEMLKGQAEMLKEGVKALNEQLKEIEERIKELETKSEK